jgi:hypothetical protein
MKERSDRYNIKPFFFVLVDGAKIVEARTSICMTRETVVSILNTDWLPI